MTTLSRELLTYFTCECEYEHVQVLASGEIAALHRFMFTVGLLVGLGRWGYRTRFCYPSFEAAKAALEEWDGLNDPPGPWIKEKGERGERSNPLTFAGIPIVEKPL
jgi:hypothetical protein